MENMHHWVELSFRMGIGGFRRLAQDADTFIDFILGDNQRRRQGDNIAGIGRHGHHSQFTQLLCHLQFGIQLYLGIQIFFAGGNAS